MSSDMDLKEIEKIVKDTMDKLKTVRRDSDFLKSIEDKLTGTYRRLQKLLLDADNDIEAAKKTFAAKLSVNSAAGYEIRSGIREISARKLKIEKLIRLSEEAVDKLKSISKEGINSNHKNMDRLFDTDNILKFINGRKGNDCNDFLEPALGKVTNRSNMSIRQKIILSLPLAINRYPSISDIDLLGLIRQLRDSEEKIESN